MHWRILAVRRLSLYRWDNEWIVTDAISGDTHLLTLLAGHIVNHLKRGAATAEELASMLVTAGLEGGDTPQAYLEALAAQDIIEACPP